MTALQQSCPRCGAKLPGDLLDGLCEACLLRFSLGVGEPPPLSDDAAGASLFDLLDPSLPEAARVFGDYELLEEMGAGGMGVVWRARQRSLNRFVAVKMIRAGQLARPEDVSRFRTEAEAVARLRHPGIVAIHEVGEVDGQHFFSMELAPGTNLAQCLRQGPLAPRRTAAILRQLALVIQHAHERGIIHRDLKPSNILLDAEDQPRVTDFGLAKIAENASEITRSDAIIGSPGYMAPEQAAGRNRELDGRADLHALGVILYELLTGRPPYQSDSVVSTLKLVLEAEPVAPRQLNPGIPRDLETICLKCLEKEPGKRYATAQEFADELDRFLKDEPIHARPVSRAERVGRWCRREPALAGALGAAVLFFITGIAGVLWQWQEAQSNARAAREAAALADANALRARRAQYASDMNLAHQAVQDGDFFRARQLLERHRPVVEKLGARSQEPGVGKPASSPNSIPAPESGLLTSPSPDLRGWEWHYLWRETQGDPHRVLLQLDQPTGPLGMLPDGKTVFVGSGDKTVRLLDLESGRETGVLQHPEWVVSAAASPDGHWLVSGTSGRTSRQPLRLWDLETKIEAAVLISNFWLRSSLVFSPDNRTIAFPSMLEGFWLWDLAARQALANFPTFNPNLGPMGVAFSPDGRWLAFAEHDRGALALIDVERRSIVRRWTGHQATVLALAYSPDGQTLASVGWDGVIKLWDTASFRERASLTAKSRLAFCLAFSPDGQWLACGSGGSEIWLLEPRSGERAAELRGHVKLPSQLVFALDGRTLLSTSADGTLRAWPIPPPAREDDRHELPGSISTEWSTYGPAIALAPDASAAIAVFNNLRNFAHWRTDETFGISPSGGPGSTGHRSPGRPGSNPGQAMPGAEAIPTEAVFPLPFTNASVAAVAPGGRTVAFANWRGRVVFWDAGTRQTRDFAQAGTNGFNRMAFSHDGTVLALGNRDGLCLWSVPEARELRVIEFPGQEKMSMMSLAFSRSGRHVMAGFFDGTVRVWDLANAARETILSGHTFQVRGLGLLPDERTLISTSTEIRVWDLVTGRELLQLSPRPRNMLGVALSPDGRRLAVGAADGLTTLWDTASWHELATLPGHTAELFHLAFTPDGQTLLSASRERLRVWQADTDPDNPTSKGTIP